MRFQKLKIHNIASIVDAEIDFENSALADSEVFLITGQTGSGKSTILDSICLALYADTPRLKNTKMQGEIKDGEENINVKNAVQLMRRNCVDAYVELTFIGSNDVHYKARWEVSRARRKIAGRLNEKWQLENLHTQTTLTKKGEIKEEIDAAIGLGFDQFCRTTMLAQGEFTRFLNSKDNEKAEILEKITGVDIYSKIGAKIFDVRRQKLNEWSDAKEKVDSIRQTQMTAEEISQEQENLNTLEAEHASLLTVRNSDNDKLNWLTGNIKLIEAIALAKHKWLQLEEYKNSEEFQNKERLVTDWNATIDARGWMSAKQRALEDKENRESVLAGFVNSFTKYLGGYGYLLQEISEKQEAVKNLNDFLTSQTDWVRMYDNIQTITTLLNRIRDNKNAAEKGGREIQELKTRLDTHLGPQLTKSQENLQQAKQELENIESVIGGLGTEIANLNLRALRIERQSATELLNFIDIASRDIEQLAEKKNSRSAQQKALENMSAEIDKNKASSAKLDDPVSSAKQKMEICKEKYERQCATVDEFAKKLRLNLQIGDVCPVCQQTVMQQLPNEEELQKLVSAQKEDYDTAKQEYDNLYAEKEKLDREIDLATRTYNVELQKYEQDKSVEKAEQLAVESCKKCGIQASKIDCSTSDSLQKLRENALKTKETLDVQIGDGEAKESELDKLRKNESATRNRMESLRNEVINIESQVNNCTSQITTKLALVDSQNSEIETASSEVEQLINPDVWNIDWRQNPTEFIESLTSAKQRYDTAVQEQNNISSQLANLNVESQRIETAIQATKDQMPSWSECEPQTINKINNLEGEFNELNKSISVEKVKLEQTTRLFEENSKLLEKFLVENSSMGIERLIELNRYTREDIENEIRNLQAKRDEHIAARTSLNDAQDRQCRHMQEKPELDENDTEELLKKRLESIDMQLNENSQQQGAIKQKFEANKQNESELQSIIVIEKQKKAEYDKWDRLCNLIGDDKGKVFRTIAQSYILANLIHSANSYMRTLTDRYILKGVPGTFVILIEDAYQGYASRAASTISGGESFLVSLSLALALSDIGHRFSVDTLFIDEGFGTLSGEPLQNAINTLRSLHDKSGRHVGIISHIKELRDHILVQIQVNQDANDSSSTVKIVDTRCQ